MSASGIWAIIGIIVLVSIIFGVSLHDAFWGIVVFAALLALFFIVLGIIFFISLKTIQKIKASNTPEGRKAKELKRQKRIIEAKNDAMGGLVFLWIVSPLLIAVLLATTSNSFTVEHPLLTFVLAASPFFAGIIGLFLFGTKGQSGKERLKSFGRFSWGILKLFLITLAVIVGLGLIIVLINNIPK